MPLADNVVQRLFKEGDVIALRFRNSAPNAGPRSYVFRIDSVEMPNDLHNFSLGSASALNSAGTGWQTVTNSSGIRWLEPGFPQLLYQIFYGVAPNFAWVYRQYQSGQDRGSLISTRAIGDPVGFVDGRESPFRSPDPRTELVTINGIYPAFQGYHPYAEPSSITVFLNFYVALYGFTDITSTWHPTAPPARTYTMGGRTLIDPPSWLGGGRPDRQ